MTDINMCASELEFDLHYKLGEYFILVDQRKRIIKLFDDTELDRTIAVNWMHKMRESDKISRKTY